MFHGSGKDNLRLGLPEMLQFADKMIQFGRSSEKNFYQHRIVARDAVAFDHIGTAADVGVKFLFLDGFHFQIDERLDIKTECLRIDVRIVALDIAVFFQLFDTSGNRRGRKKGFFPRYV